MRSTVMLSWALCFAIFTTSYSSRILQVALQTYVRQGMQYGISFIYGWNTVALLAGAVFGPLLVWLLSLYLNRKPVVLIALATTTLSAILVVSASSAVQVVVAGGFAGLSNTMMLTTACLWQAENAEPHRRGQMIVLLLVAAGAGSALCSWVNYILNMTSTTLSGVRTAVGVQLVFALAAVLLLVFCATDSYRWLLSHNKPDEARATLARMRGQDQSSPELLNYFGNLVQHRRQLDSRAMCSCCAASRKTNNDSGIMQLHTPRRLGLAAGVQIMAAFTGIQAAGYYLVYLLFDMFSSGPFFAHGLIMAFIPSFDLLFTLLPYFLLPRLGIRKLLLIGCIGISICGTVTVIIAAATTTNLTSVASFITNSPRDPGPSAALFVFVLFTVFFYDLSWAALTWLFVAEIASSLGYHNENTAVAALSVALRYVLEIGITFAISAGTVYAGYWLIVGCLILNIIFAAAVWSYYPETVGRTLEDIDLYFARAPKKVVCRDREATRVWRRGRSGTGGGAGGAGYATGAEWRQMHGQAEEMQTQTPAGFRGLGDDEGMAGGGASTRRAEHWK